MRLCLLSGTNHRGQRLWGPRPAPRGQSPTHEPGFEKPGAVISCFSKSIPSLCNGSASLLEIFLDQTELASYRGGKAKGAASGLAGSRLHGAPHSRAPILSRQKARKGHRAHVRSEEASGRRGTQGRGWPEPSADARPRTALARPGHRGCDTGALHHLHPREGGGQGTADVHSFL